MSFHVTKCKIGWMALSFCELFSRLNSMAARVLHVFVRHVSFLRDLGEGGKLRLAADMAQVRWGNV